MQDIYHFRVKLEKSLKSTDGLGNEKSMLYDCPDFTR
jgi:hypothetical protein